MSMNSSSMMPDEQVRRLMCRYLDGECSSDETNELRELVAHDRRRVEELLEMAEETLDLGRVLREMRAARKESSPVPAPARTFAPRLWPAAAAAVLLAAAGVWWGMGRGLRSDVRGQVLARITEAGEDGGWRMVDGKTMPLAVGDELRVGTRIETTKGASVRFQYAGDQSFVDLSDQSDLSVSEARKLDLHRGRLAATVAHSTASTGSGRARQRKSMRFVVSTPHAEAEVIGTRFALEALQNRTRLDVFEGLVRFTRLSDGKSVEVGPGKGAVAQQGVALVVMPGVNLGKGPLYVDGPVFFRDDFEKGIGDWKASILDKKAPGGARELGALSAQYAKTATVQRDGVKSTVLVLDKTLLKRDDEVLYIEATDATPSTGVYSLEYELLANGRNDNPWYAWDNKTLYESGKWYHVRVEHFPDARSGRVQRIFCDGNLVLERNLAAIGHGVSFEAKGFLASMFVDNVVVREMRPAGAEHN